MIQLLQDSVEGGLSPIMNHRNKTRKDNSIVICCLLINLLLLVVAAVAPGSMSSWEQSIYRVFIMLQIGIYGLWLMLHEGLEDFHVPKKYFRGNQYVIGDKPYMTETLYVV